MPLELYYKIIFWYLHIFNFCDLPIKQNIRFFCRLSINNLQFKTFIRFLDLLCYNIFKKEYCILANNDYSLVISFLENLAV